MAVHSFDNTSMPFDSRCIPGSEIQTRFGSREKGQVKVSALQTDGVIAYRRAKIASRGKEKAQGARENGKGATSQEPAGIGKIRLWSSARYG